MVQDASYSLNMETIAEYNRPGCRPFLKIGYFLGEYEYRSTNHIYQVLLSHPLCASHSKAERQQIKQQQQ